MNIKMPSIMKTVRENPSKRKAKSTTMTLSNRTEHHRFGKHDQIIETRCNARGRGKRPSPETTPS